MAEADSFADVMKGLGEGEEEAARKIFDRFAARLVQVARKRLSPEIRRVVEPDDIMNSVLKSFMIRQREEQLETKNWDNLWGLLVLMAVRKCHREHRNINAKKRNWRREEFVEDLREILSKEPTPEQEVALQDVLAKLMSSMNDLQREILTLRLQSYTVSEISSKVKRTERTVHRVLKRVREQLEVRLGPREE